MNESQTLRSKVSRIRPEAIVLLVTAAAVVAENYRSYLGFFKSDDFSTLSWTPSLHLSNYLHAYFSLRFMPDNFRPVASVYYRVMDSLAPLQFPLWVVGVQAIALISAILLWFLLTRMNFRPLTCAIGCSLLLLHPSLFDANWKPMYVFDASCTLFVLLSILAYLRGRWIISLLSFYTAYRCKEIAITLPLALAAWEVLLGKRQWKRLIPFFALSVCFGVQAVLYNRSAVPNAYSLLFGIGSLRKTLPFYSRAALAFTGSGLTVAILSAFTRDRRAWFGVLAFWLLLITPLFLPGRLFAAYACVPMVGLIIAVASLVESRVISTRLALALFLVWVGFSGLKMRKYARNETAASAGGRAYVMQLETALRRRPSAEFTVVYNGLPDSIDPVSFQTIVNNLTRTAGAEVVRLDEIGSVEPDASGSDLLLRWDEGNRRLYSESVALGTLPFLRVAAPRSAGQLLDGWYAVERGSRWTAPEATARLARPAIETILRADFFVPEGAPGGPRSIAAIVDGGKLGSRQITGGVQAAEWPTPPATSKTSTVQFRITPPIKASGDPRQLGVVMLDFGFIQRQRAKLVSGPK